MPCWDSGVWDDSVCYCTYLQADRELMFRRSLPSCSPQAVAAARILSAQSPAELEGRSAESLGQWKQSVSPINEVNLRSHSPPNALS